MVKGKKLSGEDEEGRGRNGEKVREGKAKLEVQKKKN